MASNSMPVEAAARPGLGDIGAQSKEAESDQSPVEVTSGDLSAEVQPWRERITRSIKKSRAIRGGNYVQVATVDEHGKPRNRTMVFRGFQTANERPGQEAFKLITDARSDKVQQGPSCELVWWFSRSSEQFRVSGSLQFVGSDEQGELRGVREEQWKRLSDPAREQFYWKQPWVAYEGSAEPPKGGRDADGAVMAPPDTFLLMLLWPNQVKYLNLRNNFAQLDVREEGEWRGSRTNP